MAYPALIDPRTLLYVQAEEGRVPGSGDRCRATHPPSRQFRPRGVPLGLRERGRQAAGRDGCGTQPRSLERCDLRADLEESAVTRFAIPAVRATAPRFGPGLLFYLSSSGGSDGIWRFQNGVATVIWKPERSLLVRSVRLRTGDEFAFRQGGGRSHCIWRTDGTNARSLAPRSICATELRGRRTENGSSPCPARERTSQILKIPVEGGQPIRIAEGVLRIRLVSRWEAHRLLRERRRRLSRHGVTSENRPFPLPELFVRRDWDRYRFLPDGKGLVLLRASFGVKISGSSTWPRNIPPAHEASAGHSVRGFDVSPDGKHILFDRYRENSDIVLIDLPAR